MSERLQLHGACSRLILSNPQHTGAWRSSAPTMATSTMHACSFVALCSFADRTAHRKSLVHPWKRGFIPALGLPSPVLTANDSSSFTMPFGELEAGRLADGISPLHQYFPYIRCVAAMGTGQHLASDIFDAESNRSVRSLTSLVNYKKLLDIDPAFYEIGHARHVRAYGIAFKEGPDGVGIYSAKDIPYLRKPRIIMEIPVELMISVSKYPPWIFHPDFVPLGHPIFDIINATDAELDWDIRLACLLLLAIDTKDHFWQLYSDFLPEPSDCTSLLFATEGELLELQDEKLAQTIRRQQKKAESTWTSNWKADSPLKLKRLAMSNEQFKWAVAMAQTRHITMTMTVGARPQEANMLIPYADMLNHSFQPTCSCRWRRKDRMLEVLVNRGQSIKAGTEMTLNYMERLPNERYLELFGFSSPANAWDQLSFSGKARIHLDSFLSAFNIAGLPDEYYYNEAAAQGSDNFVDGFLIAAARNLPFWSEKDLPFLPSMEKDSVKELQDECLALLDAYPTTLDFDIELLNSNPKRKSRRWRAAIEYRIHKKSLVKKTMMALDLYLERLLF